MREIKYRAKRIDNNEWVYGCYVHIDYHNSLDYVEIHRIILLNGHDFEINVDTLGQYTGVKDKNNIEIYEGDIVKSTTLSCIRDNGNVEYMKILNIVKYDEKYARFKPLDSVDNRDFEVIGNNCENPELIKK